MKKYIIAFLSLISALCGSAAEILSLDQIRELALKNNVAIRNSSLQTEVAKAVRQEAFTKYFPMVSAAGMAFTTNNSVIKYDYSDKIPLPPIPGILPDGGMFDIDLEFSMIKKGVMAGVNLVQPVFLGGMILNGNKLAEVGEAVAELQARQTSDQVLVTVEQYYWQLAALKSKHKTIDRVISMLDTLEKQVNVAVEAGVVLKNDLLEVQLKRNEMLSDRVELDNGIAILSILLGQYIGKGTEPIEISADISPDSAIEKPAFYYVSPADALFSTKDYQLLKQNVKATEIERKLALGANLPKVAVGAGYFYHNMLEQNHGFGSIYAVVSVPISGWWGGSHLMKQTKLKADMARNQLEDYSELLQVKMDNAWDALNTSYDKVVIARQSIELAEENLRLNSNFYRAGTITVTDLLKAQSLYLKSFDQFTESFGDYKIKTVEYLQSTGR